MTAMRANVLMAIQAVAGLSQVLQKKFNAAYNRTPLFYDGDGGNGNVDYVKYVINKALPYGLKGLASFHERVEPVKTDLRFQHATPEQVLANYNNTLVSNCPIRYFNRGRCVHNSTYSDIHVIEDRLVDAVVVVLANNKMKKIVVSYRATLTTQNWLDNLNDALIDLPGAPVGVRVHRGVFANYLASYNRVNAAVDEMLRTPRFRGYSVLVTGYSLGGALAMMALPTVTQVVRDRPDPRFVELISVAAPRMGNADFASYLHGFGVPVTRLTLSRDIVSHLPLRRMGYTHAGAEIHTDQPAPIGRYTMRVCSQEYDEDPECSWAENDELNGIRHGTPFGRYLPHAPFG